VCTVKSGPGQRKGIVGEPALQPYPNEAVLTKGVHHYNVLVGVEAPVLANTSPRQKAVCDEDARGSLLATRRQAVTLSLFEPAPSPSDEATGRTTQYRIAQDVSQNLTRVYEQQAQHAHHYWRAPRLGPVGRMQEKRPVSSPRETNVTGEYIEAAGRGQSRSGAVVQATCGQHKATQTEAGTHLERSADI
jgi:hypothetical protein